ncbi:tRNA (adenosine(37)-N6)-threonylcarbamoyltransferase complex ATPase subunit type 1 TsaE [Primorskyibacter sp. S187A]|uniref:tRNA (adenosine(37)-N6)-threonylcarbamoyltransferase complex ATPase subunit type 1 TsaE n=1 Tax=Primorskyibacter sp. S187A TaxID=3415130 RepID=UPI003C7B89D9
MPSTAPTSFHLNSPEETEAFARRVAALVDGPTVLLLEGEIGAGKSHFSRAFIRACGATDRDIPSPTFTLVQTYETPLGEIWHCDLYRLTSLDEIDELGLFAAFDTAICLVEWPDRLGSERPTDALILQFKHGAAVEAREVTLRSQDARWAPLRDAVTS